MLQVQCGSPGEAICGPLPDRNNRPEQRQDEPGEPRAERALFRSGLAEREYQQRNDEKHAL